MSLPTYVGTTVAGLGYVCALPSCADAAWLIVLTRYGVADDRHTPLCQRHAAVTLAVLELVLTKEPRYD